MRAWRRRCCPSGRRARFAALQVVNLDAVIVAGKPGNARRRQYVLTDYQPVRVSLLGFLGSALAHGSLHLP
jgi:hypothetical protein